MNKLEILYVINTSNGLDRQLVTDSIEEAISKYFSECHSSNRCNVTLSVVELNKEGCIYHLDNKCEDDIDIGMCGSEYLAIHKKFGRYTAERLALAEVIKNKISKYSRAEVTYTGTMTCITNINISIG